MSDPDENRLLFEHITTALSYDNFLECDHAREAAFHLVDWIDDLREFSSLLLDENKIDPACAQRVILKFLDHVPAHVAAAARIVTDHPVTDVFEIGAVEGDGIAKREPGMKPGPE